MTCSVEIGHMKISMCLDLTLENVVTVTDVIGYEYAHQARMVGALAAGHQHVAAG